MAISVEPRFRADAALTHDVRNSVAALRLLVEGARDGILEATPESGFTDRMMLHIRLLGDLLAEGDQRLERRAGAATMAPVAIGVLLEQWCEAMRPRAQDRGVSLRLDVEGGLPDVPCRASQIARVMLNLVGNAIRHTPGAGTVQVRGLRHPGGVQVQVNDTGPGLPRAVSDTVFDGCRRAPAEPAPGAMGLTIARSIVHAHGGALWAASPPRGASLRFYLPATASAGA